MHRRTLYENVDSAKIKVPFYKTDIDILRVASMHRIGIVSIYYDNLFIIIINKCIIIYFCYNNYVNFIDNVITLLLQNNQICI